MNPALWSAAVGLIGSLVGGASTFAASWFTQRGQLRTHTLVQQSAKREALYAEFIVEASKRIAEAWTREADDPTAVAALYSAIGRMRLTSSPEVLHAADEVIRQIVESYAAPGKSFEDLRRSLDGGEFRDPLRKFSEVCRAELTALGG
jgi:hypothetical protein